MAGNVNTGFGLFAFGAAPFGTVDWGKNQYLQLLPPSIWEDDADDALGAGRLLKYVKSVAPSLNEILDKIHTFRDLQDPYLVPDSMLADLGANYGVEVDNILTVAAQRGLVREAFQWYRAKGREKAYQIRANLAGFGLSITPFWRIAGNFDAFVTAERVWEIPAGSGLYYTDVPAFLPNYDETPGDVIACDTYLWEYGESPPEGVVFHLAPMCGYCPTSKIRLSISVDELNIQPNVSILTALQRIIDSIEDVRPIHHQIVQQVLTTTHYVGVGIGVQIDKWADPEYNVPVIFE